MNRKTVLEWIFLTLLSVSLMFAGAVSPILAPLTVLTSSAPFMIIALRMGQRFAFLSLAAGSAVMFSAFGPLVAVVYVLAFGVLGMAFAFLALHVKSGGDYALFAIGASVALKVIVALFFVKTTGSNPFEITPEAAQDLVNSIRAMLSGGFASTERIESYARTMVETASLLMPSMMILFSACDTLVVYSVVSSLLKKIGGPKIVKLPPFAVWRFPKNIFWALLASLLADFASRSLPDNRVYVVISANLMEVMRGIFTVQGLSLAWYYMTSKSVARPFKILFVAVSVIISPISYMLSMVGVFDIWYDLRNRIRRKQR